jgi:hypothetical protein
METSMANQLPIWPEHETHGLSDTNVLEPRSNTTCKKETAQTLQKVD